jgi:hypothetical protein
VSWLRIPAPPGATLPAADAAAGLAVLAALADDPAGSAGLPAVCLTITGTGRRVALHVGAPEAAGAAGLLAAGVAAAWPQVRGEPVENPFAAEAPAAAAAAWAPDDPLVGVRGDPLPAVLGALGAARPGELGLLAVLLGRPPGRALRRLLAEARQAEAGEPPAEAWWLRLVSGAAGAVASGLGDALAPAGAAAARAAPGAVRRPNQLRCTAAREVAAGCVAATIRTGWWADAGGRAAAGHAALAAALRSAGLSARPIPAADLVAALSAAGQPARRPAVLSIAALARLIRVPGAAEPVPALLRAGPAAAPPVRALEAGGLAVAESLAPRPEPLGFTVPGLLRHGYVIGPSGTGKTALLTRLVLGLAATGTASVVVDPHGDLVRQVLLRLPEPALSRTTVLEFSDPGRTPSLNPLWVDPAVDPDRRAVARAHRSGAVVEVFQDLWQLAGPATPNLLYWLRAALDALLATGRCCLADLPRFLSDPAFRMAVIGAGEDQVSRDRWRQFAALSRGEQSAAIRAVLNKAGAFVREPVLARAFGDPGPGLQLSDYLDGARLLLVNLARGLVAEGTGPLIGSLLVSSAYQVALAREERPPAARPPAVVVIDEFQDLALSGFAKVVTAGRKYGLGLVVANQNLATVQEIAGPVLSTLLANVANLVAFGVAADDARRLAGYLPGLTAADLAGLPQFACYLRRPGPAGPEVVAARSLPPARPVRSEEELGQLTERLAPPAAAARPRFDPPGSRADGRDWR